MNHRTLRKTSDIRDMLHSVQPEQVSMAALLPQFSVLPVRVAATLNGACLFQIQLLAIYKMINHVKSYRQQQTFVYRIFNFPLDRVFILETCISEKIVVNSQNKYHFTTFYSKWMWQLYCFTWNNFLTTLFVSISRLRDINYKIKKIKKLPQNRQRSIPQSSVQKLVT